MSIASRLQEIKEPLPDHVTLVAVSKTKPVADIQEAYDAGHRHFGENKAQELAMKFEELPKDIHWHMIGHMQTNKVKYIAPFVHLIHGVDSEKLLKEIDKRGRQNERVIDCLLQFHIAEEQSKFGFSEEEAIELLSSGRMSNYPNVRICGVMGMATFTSDQRQVREEFHHLAQTFRKLKHDFFSAQDSFAIVSMGMSGDYSIAVSEGSTMVRVGSSIFGAR